MSSSQVLRTICGVGLGVAMFASAAQAQPFDKRTYFTFSAPVALPGVTLPAGRYEFRIVDTTTSRKVIQVLSDDGKKPYVMANTINDTKLSPVNDATVSFYETPRGAPAAVKSWWYPGESIGYQFIYPRSQAKQIAKNTGQSVLTTKGDTTKAEETKTAALSRVDANGRDTDVNAPDAAASAASNTSASNRASAANNASSSAFSPSTSVASNEAGRTPPQASRSNAVGTSGASASQNSQNTGSNPASSTSTAGRTTLPKTASTLPFVGLIGMLSALGFVALRYGQSLRS